LSLNVETVVTGPFQENSYIAWYPDSQDAVLVDPGEDDFLIIQALEDHDLVPIAIINTHAHSDHIGAVQPLKEKYDIPFYLHKDEKFILNTYEMTCRMFGMPPKKTPEVDHWFKGEGRITIGDFQFNTVNTPGHTPGGTCLEIDNHIFVGDTLFRGSVGRTDLPGGNWDTLESSLVHLMNSIPHDRIVHSGHGPITTLADEMKENPFLISLINRVN
jgi:glyoxylase-like metal-dependent hydrolase (beta-lactamase superfamily II)|tara:strand:+ start:22914 stop:23561 length:648 start_codon:yes stop_codon:yes gene_type:complete